MGELNQLAILALVQVLKQNFVRVVTERQYNRCCRPQVAQFFSKYVYVACDNFGVCFQVLHHFLGIDFFEPLDDVGHVGSVVGRAVESVPNLERTTAFAMEIEKRVGRIPQNRKVQPNHNDIVPQFAQDASVVEVAQVVHV